MSDTAKHFSIQVEATNNSCPSGEQVGVWNLAQKKIPVLSCEGGCIRGEIARVAAHLVAKEEPFSRGCHGELISVPQSAIAQWIHQSDTVVLIDGCFLRCHGRILRGLLGERKLVEFDALSHYQKYTDVFDIDAVPPQEREAAASSVAEWVLTSLKERT